MLRKKPDTCELKVLASTLAHVIPPPELLIVALLQVSNSLMQENRMTVMWL
jgi:hypothetical protein